MQRNLINGLLLTMLGGALLMSAPAGAQTYKWTDAEGKIHYSDQPPPPNVKEQVTVKPRQTIRADDLRIAATGDKGTTAAKPKTYAEQEAEFKKRHVEAAEREAADKKKADEVAERKKNLRTGKCAS